MHRRTFLRSASVVGAASTAGCVLDGVTDLSEGMVLLGRFPGEGLFGTNDPPPEVYEEWLGRTSAVVVLFVASVDVPEWTDEFVRRWMTAVWEDGHVPLVTWEPYVSTAEASDLPIEVRIHRGEFDEEIRHWARRLEQWATGDVKRRFYFRPAHEMNGNWYPWATILPGATPADYVSMWRHLHGIFAETALTDEHVQWVWSPNAEDVGGHAAETYYPGDEYVDWIGIDGYNFGDSQPWSRWIGAHDLFVPMIDRMRRHADKPVGLAEFASSSAVDGAHRPDRKGEWIREAFAVVVERDLRMANWFNADKLTDWAVLGGQYGTSTVTIGGRRYEAYEAYREQVTEEQFVTGDPPPVITDEQFTGRFA